MNINTDTKVNTSSNMDASQETKHRHDENQAFENFQSFLELNGLPTKVLDVNTQPNTFSFYEMPFAISTNIDTNSGIQNVKSSFSFDTKTICKEDAEFFGDLFGTKEITYTQATPQAFINVINQIENTETIHEVSKTVLNLVETSLKTNQPVRLDFDNNISVILKVDKTGKITAEFLPSDAVAEQYLRNNISFLRQNFEAQNIEYNDIFYRSRKDGESQKQRQKQGEKDE